MKKYLATTIFVIFSIIVLGTYNPNIQTDLFLEGEVLLSPGVPPQSNATIKLGYSNLLAFKKVKLETLQEFKSDIEDLSKQEGVCPAMIKAIIAIESRYDTGAVSYRGAVGLMQLMPRTAKELGVNPRNPFENIKGGIKYIKYLKKVFKDDRRLVLAAYNAGPTAVLRHRGIPPFKETQEYVKKVLTARDLILKDESLLTIGVPSV